MEISLFSELFLCYNYFWVVSKEQDSEVAVLYVLENTEKITTVKIPESLWENVLSKAWILLTINLNQKSLDWKKFTYSILNKQKVLSTIQSSHRAHEWRKIDREKISAYKRVSMDEYKIQRRKMLEVEFLRSKWTWYIPIERREQLFNGIYKDIEYNHLSGKFSK